MSRILLLIAGVCIVGCSRNSPDRTVINWVPYVVSIPVFNVDSVTRDSVSTPVYALTGTVVDSTGRPLEGAQVVVKKGANAGPLWTHTDSHGGFLIGRIPAGRYDLLVRRLGFYAVTRTLDARSGVVDTLRIKMKISTLWLQQRVKS